MAENDDGWASAVQVCTEAILKGPSIYEIAKELKWILDENGYDVNEIKGLTHKKMAARGLELIQYPVWMITSVSNVSNV